MLTTNPLPGSHGRPSVSKRPPRLPLSPASYDDHEQRALEELPIPALMGFRPITFQMFGYPVAIRTERELLRFVDHNYERELPSLFVADAVFPPVGYVNRFTQDEKELLDAVRDRVAEATLQVLGRAIRPVGNLLVQTGPYRAMHHLAHLFGRPSLSVFEVGPGMGYLGGLLAATGHRYMSYDVTQSLYLWQSFLLDALAGDEFTELAALSPAPAQAPSRVSHLAWWQYCDFARDTALRADVVYSNSNLGEMSNLSLRHVARTSRDMLSDSAIGAFVYFSTGNPVQNSRETIDATLGEFGFRQVLREPFNAFVLADRDATRIVEGFAGGIPYYNPSGRGGAFDANTVMALKRAEAPLDLPWTERSFGWRPPYVD